MSSDEMRDQFEARFPIPTTCEGFNGGFYYRTNPASGKEVRHPHQEKWVVWQASRAAVVVDLPPMPQVPEDPEEAIDDSHMDAYHSAVRMRRACAQLVMAAGLKVRS